MNRSPEAMIDAPRSVFPVYVFTRRRDFETGNRILAGTLSLNIFGHHGLSRRRRELAEIIDDLTRDARAGRLPLDGITIRWPGDGRKPVNAADVLNETEMAWWRARAFTVAPDGEQTVTRERMTSGSRELILAREEIDHAQD